MKITKKNKLNEDLERFAVLKNQQKAMEQELEEIRSRVVKYMEKNGTDEIIGTDHSATYRLVVTSRIDGKALAQKHPKIAQEFTYESQAMRFTVK